MGVGIHPASGSGVGFVQQTVFGSGPDPDLKHTGRSEPRSHHQGVDL